MKCGGDYVLTGKDLEISSPNYPNIPPPFTECTWKIMAASKERISIHFIERFDLSYSVKSVPSDPYFPIESCASGKRVI